MAFGRGTVNKVILLGRVGADPEMRQTASNTPVANFSVATNLVWKDQDGTQHEETEWNRVVVWRKLAEFANVWIKKGKLVYVEGRLKTRSWEDKDGNTRYMTEIQADTVQLIGSRKDEEGGVDSNDSSGSSAPSMGEPARDDSIPEDDLPF
ncbi:single-stranded DNA-binding protein [candidate division KSB1 bacterium]|nr:single-stranded DNA-binding protein [candidate division KSB1 bacterium]